MVVSVTLPAGIGVSFYQGVTINRPGHAIAATTKPQAATPREQAATEFRRDRLTWVAYVVLAWFAYLQAAPGLVIAHLRDELHLSYSTGGLHVAAFAAGGPVRGGVFPAPPRGGGGGPPVLWGGGAGGGGAAGGGGGGG